MSQVKMPWSFSVLLVTFAIFFFSLNVYIVTSLLSHPWASDLWLIGVVVGGIGLLYSIRMLRVHQQQLIEARNEREHQESE
ncbi:MAG: hypothetical protein KAU89_08225 [Candidatus Thorarchaeota archaeon]|nr:hypothetical protein [Candidatus Thorarchaeota archaeon]